MKRIIMTLAIAGALLGFNAPGQPLGLPLGPAVAKADGGFVFYYGGGQHQGRHAKRGHHDRKHHGHKRHNKKHHGYGHDRGHGRDHGRGQHGAKGAKHAYGHANGTYGNGGCHPVSKEGYWHGRYARIGGTLCYDRYGSGYVVEGSRYLIHYY